MIIEPEKIVGKKIAYRTLSGIMHGRVVSAGLLPDVVRVRVTWSEQFATVNVTDIIKIYDEKNETRN